MQIRGRSAMVLIAPAALIFAVFVIYPLIRGVQLSFTDAIGPSGGNFVGLKNYLHALSDPTVLHALGNTIVYTIVVVVVQNGLALLVAFWLFKLERVRNFVRAGLLLPAMMAFVAVGYLWSYMYSPLGGPIDDVMDALGLHAFEPIWLGDPHTALMSIAAIYIWMFLGYTATIYLANYMAIDPALIEAANLDGAAGWRRFWSIDWRLLAPSFTINITLSVIGSLRVFDLPFIMTQGAPADATQTLSLVIYNNSFANYQFAYGTTLAVLLLILTIVVGVTQATLLRRREADLA
ncbi:carbohydrate ABC transporter permease [Leifsonia sp. NPDC056665]|uniref:carbohydrate ABC transporter permease n=1 Tax=Leifsonia sp. NPDC056665 TaxID=3345901 RepID=UPI0036BA2EAD